MLVYSLQDSKPEFPSFFSKGHVKIKKKSYGPLQQDKKKHKISLRPFFFALHHQLQNI